MIRLHRLDHVCLRVADLDEASARWQLQFGLVERSRGLRTSSPRLQRRALLPRARRGRERLATTISRSSSRADCPLDEARAHFEAVRCCVGGARGLALRRRPGRPSRPGAAVPCTRHGDRSLAPARASLRDRAPRRRAQARPRQLPHRGHPRRLRFYTEVLGMKAVGLARRGRRLVPRQHGSPRDGARRPRLRPLSPSRVRDGRHREDARHARPRGPARALARLGADPPRDRRQHRELRADRRGGVLRRALLRHGADSGRPRARASIPTTATRRTRGARCRRARTSASTRSRSSTSGRASRRAATSCRR